MYLEPTVAIINASNDVVDDNSTIYVHLKHHFSIIETNLLGVYLIFELSPISLVNLSRLGKFLSLLPHPGQLLLDLPQPSLQTSLSGGGLLQLSSQLGIL